MNDIQYSSLDATVIFVRLFETCSSSKSKASIKSIPEQKMPAISPQRMQDRYDAILDAAKGAFADKGFEGTSIADIARIAQISDGLVYRYFRNKRELLYEVLRQFYERILLDLETQAFKHDAFSA